MACFFFEILRPEPGPLPEDAPEYGLTIDSIPTLEAGEEDEEKSKAAFQRTWAVDVLVDLFALGEQARQRGAALEGLPFRGLATRTAPF